VLSGRFELVNGGIENPSIDDDSIADGLFVLDEMFAKAIGMLAAPLCSNGCVRVERIPGTWRWMVDFDTNYESAADILILALKELTNKVSTSLPKLTRTMWKIQNLSDLHREAWLEFCLLSLFTGGLMLEVDIPGATDGIERFTIPESFTDAVQIQDYRVIPFEERFDCLVATVEEDDSRHILHASTLEDLAPFEELAMEFSYAYEGGISATDRVDIKANRKGVAIMSEGSLLLHRVYLTNYTLRVRENTQANF